MRIEITHDFLAKKVFTQASISDRDRVKAARYLQGCYVAYQDNENLLLTYNDLIHLQPQLAEIALSEEEEAYVAKSKKYIQQQRRKQALQKYALVACVCIGIFGSWVAWERRQHHHTSYALAEAQDTIQIMQRNAQNYAKKGVLPLDFKAIVIQGQVINEVGTPLPNTTIGIASANTQTDEAGNFDFHLILPSSYLSESWQLDFRHKGYQNQQQLLDLDQNKLQYRIVLSK